MATTAALSVQPVTKRVGAVIGGVDLREPLAPAVAEEVRRVLTQYGVVFFRDQDLTSGHLHDFVSNFGRPINFDYFGDPDQDSQVWTAGRDDIITTNVTPAKAGTAVWHTDITWIPKPPAATALRAVKPPAYGGDTCWANMEAAYEALSNPLKSMLDGLTAVNSMQPTIDREPLLKQKLGSKGQFRVVETVHPVVRLDPRTGRKALYVNECTTTRIVEMKPMESMHLLASLFAHIRTPDFQVRWRWSANDLAFWDNLITQHYAVPDYDYDQERVMQRIELAGEERPLGPS